MGKSQMIFQWEFTSEMVNFLDSKFSRSNFMAAGVYWCHYLFSSISLILSQQMKSQSHRISCLDADVYNDAYLLVKNKKVDFFFV